MRVLLQNSSAERLLKLNLRLNLRLKLRTVRRESLINTINYHCNDWLINKREMKKLDSLLGDKLLPISDHQFVA